MRMPQAEIIDLRQAFEQRRNAIKRDEILAEETDFLRAALYAVRQTTASTPYNHSPMERCDRIRAGLSFEAIRKAELEEEDRYPQVKLQAIIEEVSRVVVGLPTSMLVKGIINNSHKAEHMAYAMKPYMDKSTKWFIRPRRRESLKNQAKRAGIRAGEEYNSDPLKFI